MGLPKPYYQDDRAGITIYHADCRDILPHLPKVDLVLTDPPYGISGSSGTIGKARGKGNYGTGKFEDTEEYIKDVCVKVFSDSLISSSGRGIITPGNRCAFYYPPPRDIGGIYQPTTAGIGHWGYANLNIVLFYGRDPRIGKTISHTVKSFKQLDINYEHPCVKPISAWKWLMEKGSLDGETVLDPFMGSGTTLRAAKDLGRKAIGIEIEEKYCEIAVKRLAQEVLPI